VRPARLIGLAGAALAACATVATQAPGNAPGIGLPPGAGREILVNQCLNCHELGALELFQGFYDRERWRSLVITMRGNGAVLDDDEVEVLAGYLAEHFGTGN